MGSCIFRGNCALIALSFARIRSRRVLRSSKERAAPRFDADVGEPEKRKCFRLPQPTAFAAVHSRATKLDQPRLFRMQRKRECFHTRFEVRQKRLGLFLVLETADNVVGVAHDYHLAASLAFPPLSRPEVKNEMETLAMACPGILPSDSRISSAPRMFVLSRLNGWPMHPSAEASRTPSRAAAQGSRSMWFATPSSSWNLTMYSLPAPAHSRNRPLIGLVPA